MDGMVSMQIRFQAQLLAAAISNPHGYHSRGFYLDEARRLGFRILPLDVNASRLDFHGGEDWIRPGLLPVGGCREAVLRVLVRERGANGRFSGMIDLLGRVPLHRWEAANLVLAGGMESFGMTRPESLRLLDVVFPSDGHTEPRGFWPASAGEAADAFGSDRERDFCLMRKCLLEAELLGCALSADLREAVEIHPLAGGSVRASDVGRYLGTRVRVVGLPLTQRLRPALLGGERTEILCLGDATGRMDVGFGPRALERWECAVNGGEWPAGNLLVVEGVVRGSEGDYWVDAEDAVPAPWLTGLVDFGIASRRLMEGCKNFPAYAEGAGSLAA